MENVVKMRCPICNAKLKGGKCPYCKITDEQIMYASNTKAKKEINRKIVYNSTLRPLDVKKHDMFTITLLYGLLGAGSFFVGKKGRAIYQLISSIIFFGLCITELVFMTYSIKNEVFELFFQLSALNFGVDIVMWMMDICRVGFNKYAYPVVLPDANKIEDAKEELKLIVEKIERKNDKYKKPFIKIKNIYNKIRSKQKERKEKRLTNKQEKLTIKQQKLTEKQNKLKSEKIENNNNINSEVKEINTKEEKNTVDLGIKKSEKDGVITERREIKNNKKNGKK